MNDMFLKQYITYLTNYYKTIPPILCKPTPSIKIPNAQENIQKKGC